MGNVVCYDSLTLPNTLEIEMGYRILNVTPEFREKFVERTGLEGPFFYGNEMVLYYDPKDGKYYNPTSDMYLSYDEYEHFINLGY
jgi:hypothetical protein